MIERELDIVVKIPGPSGGAHFECEYPGPEILGLLCGLFWLLGWNDWRAGRSLSYRPIRGEAMAPPKVQR